MNSQSESDTLLPLPAFAKNRRFHRFRFHIPDQNMTIKLLSTKSTSLLFAHRISQFNTILNSQLITI